jgi:type II secretory ATPase GspE/PulE/Tfp pilus assembly ATPase PilB-like protein
VVNGARHILSSFQHTQYVPLNAVAALDYILSAAVFQGASDIHIEWRESDVGIRLRIDGILREYGALDRTLSLQIISRLKVLMGLDITEHMRPQDGALRVEYEGQAIDVRASFFPTLFGEKVVLRLLGSHYEITQLYALPFSGPMLAALYDITREAQGLFLVTGPTGAGKTTTLYAMLQAIDRVQKNVITLEDPIEYRMAQVTQTQINQHQSLHFATAIRSILRQDPDVILVGELRDLDTLQSAIEAALTGHLVLSTLHTGRASAVPIRLREMGIEPYLIAAAFKGVLAQRLLSTLCSDCKYVMPCSRAESAWALAHGVMVTHTTTAGGCTHCNGTGYAGQIVIGELWRCSAEALALLHNSQATQQDFQRCAEKDGMQTLATQGLALVRAGQIALADLMCQDV